MIICSCCTCDYQRELWQVGITSCVVVYNSHL